MISLPLATYGHWTTPGGGQDISVSAEFEAMEAAVELEDDMAITVEVSDIETAVEEL